MARRSRKAEQLGIVTQKKNERYQVAIYVRLSIEDNGVEGNSIANQIAQAKKYIVEQEDFTLFDVFIDNGYSGTNFNRPAFSQMITAIKEKQVNCIVVKDLSRFGRNYIEVGDFLERIFPYWDIRFIAIADSYDSKYIDKNSTLLLSLKSIMHDQYAKDISKKVATSLDIRKKCGAFLGKIPPYGYVRANENRHQLIIHSERAEVVRQVFQLRLDGVGTTGIAKQLNEMNIPTQLKIRHMEGYQDGKELAIWRGSSVYDLLQNPCYMGCMVERKSQNLLYQNRKSIVIQKSEWNLIRDTHEAIISEEIFYAVQDLIVSSKEKSKGETQCVEVTGDKPIQ